MDVRRILDTIREMEEWNQRMLELEARLKSLPRSQRRVLSTELEIVRQQLQHYQALVEEMKLSVTKPAVNAFFDEM
jgi:hypothetical protein